MQNIAAPPVRFGDWISEGWKMFTLQWSSWVLLALGIFVAVFIPMIVGFVVIYMGMFAAAIADAGSSGSGDAGALTLLVSFVGMFGLILLLTPISVFLIGGLYKSAFKQLRGGRLEFKDIFSGGDCFFRVFGASILISILVSVGAMLCFIPGLIAAGLLFFTIPLIIERRMGVFEAMAASYETTKPNLVMFTLFAFVVHFIAGIGQYACYIGLLATYPLLFTMTAVAYRDCFGLPGALSFLPAGPPPDIYAPPPPAANLAGIPPAARFCAACSLELPVAATFCPRCGASNRG